MFDRWFDRMLGARPAGREPNMQVLALFLRRARSMAWGRGHAEIDVDHALDAFLDVVDARTMIERRGVVVADVIAIIDQLLDARPRSEVLGQAPELSARLNTVVERSVAGDRIDVQMFVESLASALPRELTFVRPALTGAAPEIAAFFSASLSRDAEGHLTFAAWSPELHGLLGLMHESARENLKGWSIGMFHLFWAILGAKSMHAAFKARDVDTIAILRELGASLTAKHGGAALHPPPADFVASPSPALHALYIRAERYAAEDRTPVKLRHVLAAFHDEPDFAPFVEKLIG